MSALAVIPTIAAVDAAWERYRSLAAQVGDNPRILAERGFMEKLARAEAEWKQAFLAMEVT
jgi:hypothetical protein